MVDKAAVDNIRVGPCPIFINCEDKKRALVKVPAKYVHPDHMSVKAAVSGMGDHLIDIKTPEMAKKNPKTFTHTSIFGTYGGHITFYEPMITRAYPMAVARSSSPKRGSAPVPIQRFIASAIQGNTRRIRFPLKAWFIGRPSNAESLGREAAWP
jgi:hypothetical protein